MTQCSRKRKMGPEQTYEFNFAQLFFNKPENSQTKLSKKRNPVLTHSFVNIHAEPIQIGSTLGKGSFGKVKQGLDIKSDRCAIKISGTPSVDGDLQQKCIDTEISLLDRLGRLIGHGTQPQPKNKKFMGDVVTHKTYIVSEFWAGTELFEYLQNNTLNQEIMLINAIATCKEVQALHEQRIIHADIKPENFILLLDGQVKAIDFGFSMVLKAGQKYIESELKGTRGYLAPELGKSCCRYSLASDIYAVGIMLKHDFKFNSNWINELLALHPSNRPAIDQVISRLQFELKLAMAERRRRCALS